MKRFEPQILDESTWKLSTKVIVHLAELIHKFIKEETFMKIEDLYYEIQARYWSGFVRMFCKWYSKVLRNNMINESEKSLKHHYKRLEEMVEMLDEQIYNPYFRDEKQGGLKRRYEWMYKCHNEYYKCMITIRNYAKERSYQIEF